MTWIITLGLADRAFQVSDRRFTWSDGSLFDDYANKGVCLACADARVTFSYTGLAFVGSPERRTDKWLLDALVEMQAGTKPITTVVTTLEAKATEVLRSTGGDPSANDLTLVGVGLHASGDCVYLKISNAVGEDGNPLDGLRDHCTTHWYVSHHNGDPARVRLFAIDGYETAAMDVQQRLAALLDAGFFNWSATPTVVDALVEAIRHAADSDDAQGRIGKNCLSVVISADAPFQSADHRDDGIVLISHTPPFVTGQAAYGQVSTRVGWVDSPSAHVPFEQWNGLDARTTIGQRAVRLENIGVDDLTDVRLDLNVTPRQDFQGIAKGWLYSTGYTYWFPRLRAGASETIPFLSFQKFEGTSFDPTSQDRDNLTVTARLPNGEFGKYQAL